MRACIRAYIHTHIHTYIHACIRTHAHIHIHTYTHTHTQSEIAELSQYQPISMHKEVLKSQNVFNEQARINQSLQQQQQILDRLYQQERTCLANRLASACLSDRESGFKKQTCTEKEAEHSEDERAQAVGTVAAKLQAAGAVAAKLQAEEALSAVYAAKREQLTRVHGAYMGRATLGSCVYVYVCMLFSPV